MTTADWGNIYKELGAVPVTQRHRQRHHAGRFHSDSGSARGHGGG